MVEWFIFQIRRAFIFTVAKEQYLVFIILIFGFKFVDVLGTMGTLWKLDLSSLAWTAVSGSFDQNINIQNYPAYVANGAVQVFNAQNLPGCRYGFTIAYNVATKSIFIFGGNGFDTTGRMLNCL